jgi:hypothetical protein
MEIRTRSEFSQIRGTCPECGPRRWANIVQSYQFRVEDEFSKKWVDGNYYILQCCGCDEVYFQSIVVDPSDDSENIEFVVNWEPAPRHRRAQPSWINDLRLKDYTLWRLLSDAYEARDRELSVFAAIGVRTIIDRSSEILGVDPEKSFNQNISKLLEDGYISSKDKEVISTLTNAGSAAAHRGWRPDISQLDVMLSIVENFIQRAFILVDTAQSLQHAFPERVR